MADFEFNDEEATTDLIINNSSNSSSNSIDDSRVPRDRDKNHMESYAWIGGWFSCSISSTTTTTGTPPTVITAAFTTSTGGDRLRIIGDASDDRRRDGVSSCAHSDDSRYNDNNENNESDDVVEAAAAAATGATVREGEGVTETGAEEKDEKNVVVEEEEEEDAVEGVESTIVVAAAVALANEAAVVSRLEPAASEDRVRSGESVCDVVVAAGVLVDDAVGSGVRSANDETSKIKYIESIIDCIVNNEVNDVFNDDSVSVVNNCRSAAGSCAASGENGERNSEYENVENETRRKHKRQEEHKQQQQQQQQKYRHKNDYVDEYAKNNDEDCKFRENPNEPESENYNCRSGRCIRRSTTGNGVHLVERCNNIINNNKKKYINNNNNNNSNNSSSVDNSFEGVSVRDISTNDKIRVINLNFDYERSSSDFLVREEEEEDELELEEDLVLHTKNVAMQAETVTTASRKEEMAEREINDGVVVARLGSPFKGQIRTAEDTLVGPCGKKRCADRYDSSESSDSGVAVSCGDCSSSGTSDITEPGSPCSTSSDEGLGIRGTAPSPLPSLLKLAPTTPPSHSGTRPQWPWTPPLAATACSTYKRLKSEPEAGTLPKAGAADPTARSVTAGGVKQQASSAKNNHHHHESQGKITEYFKAQIKPQQTKLKKTSADMSLLVAKSSPEFRRPPTVQRNKGGLAKYLGVVLPNGRTSHEREVRTMTIAPRANAGKMDKKLCSKVLSGLPIPSEVLASIPGCKISSLRLTGEASPKPSGVSPPVTPTAALMGEPITIDFEDVTPVLKPTVNENNNLTNGQEHPLTRLTSGLLDMRERKEETEAPRADDDDEDEEEEEDSGCGQSKAPSSPILSAPTTIRFPARAPEKKGPRGTDSGICRWDKCEGRFECSGALLEHLQAAHINTQQGGDNFVCHWQGCKVQGRTSCSRRWLERHVLSHGGNKPFRCIVDGCGSRFSSQTALERHVNSHFNQPETSSSSGRRSCESGGKLVRRNGKKLRYRRQPWSARLFDYIDTGVMEGLQHRLVELAKTRTQGRLAETPGNSMALTSQVLARRVELDGKAKVLLRWYPQDIAPDEWVLESEVRSTKHIGIRDAATTSVDEISLVLYPAINGGSPPQTRTKQRRKPVKNS